MFYGSSLEVPYEEVPYEEDPYEEVPYEEVPYEEVPSCQVDFCVTPLVEAKTVWDKRNAVSQKQCPTVWLSLLVCMFR